MASAAPTIASKGNTILAMVITVAMEKNELDSPFFSLGSSIKVSSSFRAALLTEVESSSRRMKSLTLEIPVKTPVLAFWLLLSRLEEFSDV